MPQQVLSVWLINEYVSAFPQCVCVSLDYVSILRIGKIPEASEPGVGRVELALEIHRSQVHRHEATALPFTPEPSRRPICERGPQVDSGHLASATRQMDSYAPSAAGGIKNMLPCTDVQCLCDERGLVRAQLVRFKPEVFGECLRPVSHIYLANLSFYRNRFFQVTRDKNTAVSRCRQGIAE
jgi:hypothetical protein